MACGSRNVHMLAATDDGIVWAWGDGKYGKLGKQHLVVVFSYVITTFSGIGSTEGSYIPVQIPALEGDSIVQLECGTQFSVALSKSGRVYTWGRGEYFRLGTDSSAPIYQPHRLLSLSKVKVVQIAVGGLHCIALTENGEVSP